MLPPHAPLLKLGASRSHPHCIPGPTSIAARTQYNHLRCTSNKRRFETAARFARSCGPAEREGLRGAVRDFGVQRLESAEHRWQQFADGRVDVHGSLHDGIWRVRCHQIQDAMDDLVSSWPQDSGANEASRRRVDDHLDEAMCLAFFDGARYLRHWAPANKDLAAR